MGYEKGFEVSFNHGVAGSSPAGLTNISRTYAVDSKGGELPGNDRGNSTKGTAHPARFSHFYRRGGEPTEDSERMRHRIGAAMASNTLFEGGSFHLQVERE